MPAPYGIREGQVWDSADGAGIHIVIIDTEMFREQGDALVERSDGALYRIDFWKLAKVRYSLLLDPAD